MIEIDIVLSFVWSFVISVFAIPTIIYVAHLKNLLDEPNFRAVHTNLTPRLGGMAIFAGFMSAVTIFGDVTPQIQRLLASTLILFFIGLKDDISQVSAFKKFFVQILATGIVMFLGDIKINDFQGFLGIHQIQDGIAYGFTFLVIVGLINAFNLIDGLDGLAGMIILISSSAFGYFFYRFGGSQYSPFALVAFCLVGGILGFLRYNFHKAIIFMGDTGSLVCGMIVSVMAIEFVQMRVVESAPSIAVSILIIPIFDTARVFAVRIFNSKSPFSPDKNHVHHILVKTGMSQIQTVLLLSAVNVVSIAITMSLAHLGDNFLVLFFLAYFIVFFVGLEFLAKKMAHA
ncbi:MAG TPA: MraY family glycosyltransferase [Catalimonadaceae bacterium]|nr:MraY family glycosyltransferase [Catalimonadaceae bacterium]